MSSDQPAPVEEAKESEAPTAEEVQPAESPLPEVQAEETLLRQANHWHALYLDSQASVARFRADAANLQQQLADSLEREKHLSSRNLQLHCRQPCEEQEELVPAGVSQLRSLEKLLVAKDAELRRLQEELADRRAEVSKLRADRGAALSERAELETLRTELRAREGLEELLQAKELELANVRKVLSLSESSTAERLARAMRLKLQELHQSLSREDAKSQLVEAKDQQLHRLHRELAEQKELCRQVTEDAEEMRAICADRLVSCGNQEASHIRLIESLRAENAMADMRIQSLENMNMRLRLDLQSFAACSQCAETPPSSTHSLFTAGLLGQDTTPCRPKSPRERRLFYPRRMQCAGVKFADRTHAAFRYDEQAKLRSFDARGREV